MQSKWFELKNKAIILRKKGLSIRFIENKLGIPRSTLSGWFKNIKLSKKQEKRLHKEWENGLIIAREKSALAHKEQRKNRQETIKAISEGAEKKKKKTLLNK